MKKYRYRHTGMIVESSTELDSMIFEPVEEEAEQGTGTLETAAETAAAELVAEESEEVEEADMEDTDDAEEVEDPVEMIGEEWLTDAQAEKKTAVKAQTKPAAKKTTTTKSTGKKPAAKTTTTRKK